MHADLSVRRAAPTPARRDPPHRRTTRHHCISPPPSRRNPCSPEPFPQVRTAKTHRGRCPRPERRTDPQPDVGHRLLGATGVRQRRATGQGLHGRGLRPGQQALQAGHPAAEPRHDTRYGPSGEPRWYGRLQLPGQHQLEFGPRRGHRVRLDEGDRGHLVQGPHVQRQLPGRLQQPA